MIVNTPYLKAAILRVLTDTVTVKRNVQTVSPIGRTTLYEQSVYTDIPCRVVKKTQSQNTQTESSNLLISSHVLFLDTQYSIQQGDELSISRFDRDYTFVAGDPFVYETHQEVPISQKGYA